MVHFVERVVGILASTGVIVIICVSIIREKKNRQALVQSVEEQSVVENATYIAGIKLGLTQAA